MRNEQSKVYLFVAARIKEGRSKSNPSNDRLGCQDFRGEVYEFIRRRIEERRTHFTEANREY